MQRPWFILFSFLFFLPYSCFSQADNTHGLTVKGVVTHQDQPLKGVKVRVFNKKNQLVIHKKSRADGSFRVRLALDGYYVVEFSREGMLSKRLLFRTRTPKKDRVYHPFELKIVLYDKDSLKDHPRFDPDLPMGIVEYFPEKKDFDYVEQYTLQRLKEQRDLLGRN